jgi:UDP-N-acetylmuramate dehydrogenase
MRDLKAHFSGWKKTPSLAEVAEAVRGIRQSKGMLLVEGDPDCRSAGSFFKNPSVKPEVAERVKQIAASSGLTVRMFPAEGGIGEDFRGVADRAGGLQEGIRDGRGGDFVEAHAGAGESRRRDGRGDLALAEKIRAAVEARFGIRLEMEPERVGF